MRFNVIEPGDLVMTDLGLFGYITDLQPGAPEVAEVTITPGSMAFYGEQCKARGISPVINQQSYWPRSVLIIVEKHHEPSMQEVQS